jgi:hypothetical protein
MTTKFNQLLDQYAQESGFRDLADLKSNYSDAAYAAVLASMIRRAKSALESVQ